MKPKIHNDDLVGKRFGKLTVLQYEMPIRAGFHGTYKCICDCGNFSNVRKESLLSARTKSCGRCGRYEIEEGMRFGHLVTVEYVGSYRTYKSSKSARSWNCICDCGETVIVMEGELRRGARKSCGCMQGKYIRKDAEKIRLSKTRLYRIWAGMKRRCYSKNCESYKRYGARGISVCDDWKNSFKTFAIWANLNGYDDTLSIDRIDSNGNYEPANCRWIPLGEQSRNTSANRWFTYNGETHLLCDWARKVDVSPETIKRRFEQYGSPYGKGGESSA